jgi:hypothetical protein
MSLRAFAGRPSICSGAMYGAVPSHVPGAVSEAAVSPSSADAPVAELFARPKSNSFTPDGVSITLFGFRSR